MQIEAFRIQVPDTVLDDLAARLAGARFPNTIAGSGWDYGPDVHYMREFVRYWREDYDWRRHEAALNAFPQYRASIDGQWLHYLHVPSAHAHALPLVLTHGWPGSVAEFTKIIGPLVAPEAHGGDPADAFHVICPSMTGYAWSDPWPQPGCHVRLVAERQVKLMQGLGYTRYGVQGGDWGGLVSPYMALAAPAQVVGVHLNMVAAPSTDDPEEARAQGVVPGPFAMTIDYAERQKGYAVIQGLLPDQLAYALNDSPLGLAAWILECFQLWSDCDGDLDSRFTRDELITNIMLYWVTGAMPSAIRLYRESMAAGLFGPPVSYVETPTAGALFKDLCRPRRAWAERAYNITRWTEMPRGGHFAAMEEPGLLVDDIRAFFADLR